LIETETPWALSDAIDGFSAPAGDPMLIVGSAAMPERTTLNGWTQETAIATCGGPTSSEEIDLAGEPARLSTFAACFGLFHQWLTVLHQGRGYHVVWLNAPGTEGDDRLVYLEILDTFAFPIAFTFPTDVDTSTWPAFISPRHGIHVRFPPRWGVTVATSPWTWADVDPGPTSDQADRAIAASNQALVVASQKLPDGMTVAEWWADHLAADTSGMPAGCFPATQAEYEPVTVDGEPGFLHGGIAGCNFTEVIVTVGGRAYQLTAYLNLEFPSGGIFDRGTFDAWLSTVTFDPAAANDTPVANP
jgi:hypothetical protein